MLSYQHSYHAGNLADVHKHAALAALLAYLTAKDKPLSWIETHAGRGLYHLDGVEAQKTGEAEAGILRVEPHLPPDHPYARVLAATRAAHGPGAYPGSPLIAARMLRPADRLHLAELHPGEYAALCQAMAGRRADLRQAEGLALALELCPPVPRRGVLVIDPSYEVKTDYADLPPVIAALARKWNVGVIVLWYPILTQGAHGPMLSRLRRDHPQALCHEIRFEPLRPGHRMVGSGLFVVNPPWGLAEALRDITAILQRAAVLTPG